MSWLDKVRRLLGGEPTPRPRPVVTVHYTGRSTYAAHVQVARELLAEYPDDDAPSDVLHERAAAAGAEPSLVASTLRRLREPRPGAEPVVIRRRRIDPATRRVVDLTDLDSTRYRIKGSMYTVSDAERGRYGGPEYLLIPEPDNPTDRNSIAVYGKGHRVGYLSGTQAARLAPLLGDLDGDAFRVTGTGITPNSMVMWVDVPKADPLRKFVRGQV